MGSYDELSLTNRLFMRGYPFSRYRINPTPCAPLTKPLDQARVALVTTAGLYLPDQLRFEANPMGDVSFREIPTSTNPQILLEAHKSNAFDHSGVTADKNLAFPLERFRELTQKNIIGQLNHRHFSFMGSIIKPGRLIDETAPQVAQLLKQDQVDAVFLTPV